MLYAKTGKVNFNEVKTNALLFEPQTTVLSLAQLSLDKAGDLMYNDKETGDQIPLRTGDAIHNELLKILKMPAKAVNRLKTLTDDDFKTEFINFVGKALVKQKKDKANVTLVRDVRSGQIAHILPGNRQYISNAKAISIFEALLNTSGSNLKIVAAQVDANGGLQIDLISGKEITPEGRRGLMVGEEFDPGVSFYSNPFSGIKLNDYIYRLICSNGAAMRTVRRETRLSTLADNALERFYGEFFRMEREGFSSPFFQEQIDKAVHSQASISELIFARNAIMNNSSIKNDDELYQFLPEYSQTVNKLKAKHKKEFSDLNPLQLKNTAIDATVMDVVNRVTWFGSHDTGFGTRFAEVTRAGGLLLSKKNFDTENVLYLN